MSEGNGSGLGLSLLSEKNPCGCQGTRMESISAAAFTKQFGLHLLSLFRASGLR